MLGREVMAEKEEVGECIVCWVGKWWQRWRRWVNVLCVG